MSCKAMGLPGPIMFVFLAGVAIATPFYWAYGKAKDGVNWAFGSKNKKDKVKDENQDKQQHKADGKQQHEADGKQH